MTHTSDIQAGSARKFRFNRRIAALLLAGVVALGVGALMLQRYLASAEPLAPSMDTPEVTAAPSLEPALAPPPSMDESPRVVVDNVSADGVIPIVPGMPAYTVARRQFDLFQAESKALRADYESVRKSPTAASLLALEARWWAVTTRIYTSEEFEDSDLRGLREIELGVSRSWRNFLATYAAGLRAGNKELIAMSFAELEYAENLAARVLRFVR